MTSQLDYTQAPTSCQRFSAELSEAERATLLQLHAAEKKNGRYPTAHGQAINLTEWDFDALTALRYRGLVTLVSRRRRRTMRLEIGWARTGWYARRYVVPALMGKKEVQG